MDLSNKTALVKFWAPWCQPCKAIAPTVTAVAAQNGIELIEVNVDEEHQLAAQFGVRGIPMVVGLKDGAPVDQVVGAAGTAAYQDLVSKLK